MGNKQLLALGLDPDVTVAEVDRSEMLGLEAPAIYWDADVVDPELAQLVRFARACEDLGLDNDCGGDQ